MLAEFLVVVEGVWAMYSGVGVFMQWKVTSVSRLVKCSIEHTQVKSK